MCQLGLVSGRACLYKAIVIAFVEDLFMCDITPQPPPKKEKRKLACSHFHMKVDDKCDVKGTHTHPEIGALYVYIHIYIYIYIFFLIYISVIYVAW